MKAFVWVEDQLRIRFDLSRLSPAEERTARCALWDEWCTANQLRLLDEARTRDTSAAPSSVVYFVHDPVRDLIKIGTTVRPAQRVRQFKGCAVLATTPGSYKVEAWMHYRFRSARVQGEWFRPEPALLELIETLRLRGA